MVAWRADDRAADALKVAARTAPRNLDRRGAACWFARMQNVSDRAIALFWLASGTLLSAVLVGEAQASAALVFGAVGLACAGLRSIEARQEAIRERRNWIPPLRFTETLTPDR